MKDNQIAMVVYEFAKAVMEEKKLSWQTFHRHGGKKPNTFSVF
jgi:hypothetical protein